MKQLKILMFILMAITIGSCYSIEPNCDSDVDVIIEDDFWELTNGELTWSIAIANNGDIWVGTAHSEIFLSTDNGNSWVKKNNVISAGPIYSIAINPINGYIFAGAQYGMFRSTDKGESWESITSDMYIEDILITQSGEIYFGIKGNTSMYPVGGVYYSSDNGNTWIQKNNGLPYTYNELHNITVTSIALGKDGTLYAGTLTRGVYRSTNGGDTWLPSSNYTDSEIYDLTVSDDGSIFAATQDRGVLKSTNRGNTWNLCNTGIIVINNNTRTYAIMYNPITQNIFVGTGISTPRIYKSTDLGVSWDDITGGIPNWIILLDFAFNPNTGQMYALTYIGLYRLKDYP